MNIPQSLADHLISEAIGGISEIDSFQPASGGCINNGGRISGNQGIYFIKWNSAVKFPGMFDVEAKGLSLLADTGEIRVPQPIHSGTSEDLSFLILQYIDTGRKSLEFFENMGRQLARLHRHTASTFGLDHANYIGSLPQQNTQLESWEEFFVTMRLEPQLRMAVNDSLIDSSLSRQFDQLFNKIGEYFPKENPALLHGDLWSGNFMVDEKGDPCFIDPAVYYGHREVDLSFSRMFGGFDPSFYSSYHNEYPQEPGFEERVDLFNLYPLLVHANLFGSGYVSQIHQVLRRRV